jgi:peptidylprolyl isomerase
MLPRRRTLALGLACAALAVAGCGDSDSEKETAATATPTETAAPEATPEPTKPKIAKPSGKPPKRLVKKDLRVGEGPAAQPGQLVQVQYVGVSYKTGKEFDSSWDRGEPFTFPLGQQQVIPGWDQGVAGMKVGGRRRLTIPPDLAYGAQGAPPAIGPNETLVFVVDLLAIQ